MKQLKAIAATVALIASVLVANVAQAEDLVVPKTSFPVCSEVRTTYCVESVSVQAIGGAAEPLTWVASGTALNIGTSTPSGSVGVPGATALSGRWANESWGANGHGDAGYDGLFIDAKAANQYTNFLSINVRPVKVTADNSVKNSVIAEGSTNATSLNANETVTVKVRTGLFQSGVSIAIADNLTVLPGTDSYGTTLTVTARPVEVPVAAKSSDCVGETGIALSKTNQMLITFAPTNDPTSGFGVEGVSGGMTVTTNGACSASTPVWDSANSTIAWTVAAPHFAPDGKTINRGFYKAQIPVNDAALLWGLTNPADAAQALTISVTDDSGEPVTAIRTVAVKGGKILIESSGFEYSKPKITIKKNAKYKKFATKKTLTCVSTKNKKLTKKVKAYVCPTGFKSK